MQDNFKEWWQEVLNIHGFDPDPDNPEHFYDYRAAFDANTPIPKKGEHWVSKFKHDLHENRFVSGKEMGKPDIEWWDSKYDKPAKAHDVILFDALRQDFLKSLKNN